MISNLVRHTDSVEFDFVKDDRVIHFKISDNQDDQVTPGVADTCFTQYSSEQLYLIAANQIAYLDGDIDLQFTAIKPSETLDQIKAREIKDLNSNFREDFTVEEFVLF